jgi:hypothetical protein
LSDVRNVPGSAARYAGPSSRYKDRQRNVCCLRTPNTGRMLRSGRNQLTVLQGQHREFDA